METAALILQGRDDYAANEPVAGTLPLQRIIRTLKYAGIKRVALACDDEGMYEATLRATRLEAEFIFPTKHKRKKVSYQANAFEYLKGKCDRLLLVPAYYPLFDIPTVRRMAETDAKLAAPVYKGKRGYPMLLSAEFFCALIETDGDYEKLFEANEWVKVDVNDEGVVADVTAPIDAERIAAKHELRQNLRPGLKLTIRREASCYGPGIQELIRLVGETGSMQKAYSLMGMAPSYAARIIKETEAGLGFKIFEYKDNMRHGSNVTQEAKEFAAKYEAFHEASIKSVEELFKRFFE